MAHLGGAMGEHMWGMVFWGNHMCKIPEEEGDGLSFKELKWSSVWIVEYEYFFVFNSNQPPPNSCL